MAELSSFFDANMVNGVPDRQYDATAWANYFSGFIGNGVSNSPASNLQVTAGTGLQVIINNGIGYINGYYYNNTEPLTLNINTANATYPRITSIVIELNLNNREVTCKAIDGNAQSKPTVPQLIQTESTYQLQLATVYIPAGATKVGTITDTRADSNVCGWVNILVPSENSINDLAPILQGYFMGNNMALGGGYVQDCNTTCTAGYYTFAADEGSKNCPPGLQYGVLQVLVGNGGKTYNGVSSGTQGWAWQIAYLTKGEVWIRQSIAGGQWSNWQQFATTNAPTFTGATVEGTTHNNGEIYGGNITETLITNSTLEQPTINGGGMNNGTVNGGICNEVQIKESVMLASTVEGGLIKDAELNGECNNSGTLAGGTYKNPTFEGEVNNAGIINGGTVSNVTVKNTNFEGTINNFTTIQGGTYNNPTLEGTVTNQGGFGIAESGALYFTNSAGTELVNVGVNNGIVEVVNTLSNNPWLSCTPVNSGIDTVNIECNTNFMQPPNLTGGLQAMNENLVQYENIPFNVLISPGVTLTGNVEFWLLNAPNLTGAVTSGAIGIMTVTGTLNESYYWGTVNHFPVDLSQIPNMTSITQTPFAPFQIGTGTGVLYLKGNNQNLNANTTYTVQALVFQ